MKKDKFKEELLNVDEFGQQVASTLSADGRFEYPDPVPMEPPLGYTDPPDISQMIKQMVRNELLMSKLDAAGLETFEESDDFDVEDDPIDPLTPYERVFEAPPAKAGVPNGEAAVKPTADSPPATVSKPDVLPVPNSSDQKGSGTSGNGKTSPQGEGS